MNVDVYRRRPECRGLGVVGDDLEVATRRTPGRTQRGKLCPAWFAALEFRGHHVQEGREGHFVLAAAIETRVRGVLFDDRLWTKMSPIMLSVQRKGIRLLFCASHLPLLSHLATSTVKVYCFEIVAPDFFCAISFEFLCIVIILRLL